MLKIAGRTFLTGLITILPVALTVYIIYWLAVSTEAVLGNSIRALLPDGSYWPGMGLVAGIIVVMIIGVLMHIYVVQRLFSTGEQALYHVPVISSVYRSIRDLFDYFSPARKKGFEKVVAVSLGPEGVQVIGFVTQEDQENMPEEFRAQDSILVYFPMSYMIGGYTALIPRKAVRPLNMKMEEAIRFTLTGGITGLSTVSDRARPTTH